MGRRGPKADFWSKVALPEDIGQCFTWTGAQTFDKYTVYGQVRINGKPQRAHRVAYAMTGKLDPYLTIDHLCRNTLCVNSMHMEQVTRAENARRARCRSAGF